MNQAVETKVRRDGDWSLDDWLYHYHYSHAALAAEIGVCRTAITNWVNGVALPSGRNAQRLLEIVGPEVSMNSLVRDLRPRPAPKGRKKS